MELVKGVPLDEYVSNHHLNLRERIELFIMACQAVQHAHAALVVHRDLKPANILVTADGIPKLLDFGIAKQHETGHTGSAPLTPRYASPEQLHGGLITIASDVYSLGVLLQELLEAFTLPADIEMILAMARREEPQRRYSSVAQFAEDLQRYLDGLMVIARKDTLLYRWSKFGQRNKLVVALGFALVIAVGIGSTLAWRQGQIAQRRFDEVHGLISTVLNDIDDEATRVVGSSTLRKMMVEKSLTFLNRLAAESGGNEKLLQELARAYHQVGDIQGHRRYQHLGLFNESLESHLKGIEIEAKLLAKHPNDQILRDQLAWGYAHAAELYSMRGDSENALALATMAQPLAPESDTYTFVEVRIALCRVLQLEGRVEEALKAIQPAIEPALKSGNIKRSSAVLHWASEQAIYLGMLPLAMQYTNKELELLNSRKWTGYDEVRVFTAHRDLGIQYFQFGHPSEDRPCEAIPHLRIGAEGSYDVYRQDPKSINHMINTVANYQMLSAAQALCGKREAIATAHLASEIFNGDKKRINWDLYWTLAFAQLHLGFPGEAEATLAQVPDPDFQILELQADLAARKNNLDQARKLLAKARTKRAPALRIKNFQRYMYTYQQAQNISSALQLKDPTPGLREEGLKLLSIFPETDVARSIIRLRNELKK
ncbi:MAG: serine/threonine-protein kinase [Acidobacteria bacterium]|nr:serine/threonine-protein kinase [Acidobacteriota bacterium]